MLTTTLHSIFEERLAWVVVLFAAGVASYFYPIGEPSYLLPSSVIAVSLFTAYLKKSWIFIVPTIFAFGMLYAKIYSSLIYNKIDLVEIERSYGDVMHNTSLSATITSISHIPTNENDLLLIVEDTNLPDVRKIRLKIPVEMSDKIAIGNRIELVAHLMKPPQPIFPGGYDFARRSYFDRIDLIGKVKQITITATYNNDYKLRLNKMRSWVTSHLIGLLGRNEGSMLAALIVGQDDMIPKEIIQQYRQSGLAHLIAVSGLNISIVASSFFLLTIGIMRLIPAISARFIIARPAAVIAIIASAIYLLVSGMEVAAQRAFIMAAIVLFAIVIMRTPSSLRILMMAAFVVITINPYQVITPSFHMSFFAVLALVTSFNWLSGKGFFINPAMKVVGYIWSIVASSTIAAMATMSFSLYFFGNYYIYGAIANLPAMPLSTFIVMPFGILTSLLLPISEHLAYFPAIVAKQGIAIINWVAATISAMPQSSGLAHSMPVYSLVLIIFGKLLLFLAKGKRAKLMSLPFVIIGISSWLFTAQPDAIISSDGDFLLTRIDSQIYSFGETKNEYKKMVWLNKMGVEKALPLTTSPSPIGGVVFLAKTLQELIDGCAKDFRSSDLFINMTRYSIFCYPKARYITREDMQLAGDLLIYLKPNGEAPSVVYSHPIATNHRLWQ